VYPLEGFVVLHGKLGRTIGLGVVIAMAVAASVSYASLRSTTAALESADWVARTQEVLRLSHAVEAALSEVESSARGFALSGHGEYLEAHDRSTGEARALLDTLQARVQDNPAQVDRVDRIVEIVSRRLDQLSRLIAARDSGGLEAASVETSRGVGRQLMEEARTILMALDARETELLGMRAADLQARAVAARRAVWAGAVASTLLVIIGGALVGRQLAARQEAEQALRRTADEVQVLNVELERRVEELSAVNRELETFSYSVSHDLRAPLRAIEGFTRILEEDHGHRLGDEALRVTGIVQAKTRFMGSLIDDLLAFSRFSRKELEVEVVDMERLVRGVLNEMSRQGIDRWRVTVESLPTVPGDLALLRQVWVNLLDNACKFSGRRTEPSIDIGASRNGAEVVYHVRDNGVGFDDTFAEKAFGVFQRLHRQEDFEGSGVGLAIVRRIVHRHGGRVWAQARPDEGATFSFALPVAVAAMQAHGPIEVPA